MKLSNATTIANTIVASLQPHCIVIEIAGSIRRQRPQVNDVEVICLPKTIIQADLFGDGVAVRSNKFVLAVNALSNQVIRGNPLGRYMQMQIPQSGGMGVLVDLFMPMPTDFYRQLAIRTGSAEYANKVIAAGWRRIGWVGTSQGLRKQHDCTEVKHADGKSTWEVRNTNPTLPPAWKSEEEFYNWLHISYTVPENREITELSRMR